MTRGADTNAEDMWEDRDDGAAAHGNTELVGYLHENGAEVNAQNSIGQTACVCGNGQDRHGQILIEELKADKTLKDTGGDTAADSPSVQPPNHLRRHRPGGGGPREEFEKAMEEAEVVDVISTRFQMASRRRPRWRRRKRSSCKQRRRTTATYRATPSRRPEPEEGSRAFQGRDRPQPRPSNALSMKGDPEAANAIWLLNWRKALVRAKRLAVA